MAGRPDFTTPGSGGSGQTVAVSNRPEIKGIALNSTTTVTAGSSETQEVYAPSGSIYKLLGFSVNIQPPGEGSATTGSHRVEFRPLGSSIRTLEGEASYTTQLYFDRTQWTSVTTEYPANNSGEIGSAIRRSWASENQPLAVVYRNNTDVDHVATSTRYLQLLVQEVTY